MAKGRGDLLQIACCLVFDSSGRILLLKRHSRSFGAGLWAPPGGKQDPDEDLATTIVREVLEETGLGLEAVELLGAHDLHMPHGSVRMHTFRGQAPAESTIVLDPQEHEDHLWYSPDTLLGSDNLIWGLPTTLRDFGLLDGFEADPTLADGSTAILVEES